MRVASAPRRAPQSEDWIEKRNQLVLEHLGLVKVLAVRVAQRVPGGVEVSELISAGTVGLIHAAGRYRDSLGVPFEAFARTRVHGAMLDVLRGLDWAPRSLRRRRRDLDQTIARLRHELHAEPSDAQIAEALHVPVVDYERMLDQIKAMDAVFLTPLDVQPEDGPMLELAVDQDEGAQVHLERAELRRHLAKAITELPERERQVLALYYHEELTLAEIGEVIGVGESRVSQLRTQAIARLRGRLRETLQLTELR
jgi:RNA polymerase sigma factor FliA